MYTGPGDQSPWSCLVKHSLHWPDASQSFPIASMACRHSISLGQGDIIILKLAIIFLDKLRCVVPGAPHWSLGLHKGGLGPGGKTPKAWKTAHSERRTFSLLPPCRTHWLSKGLPDKVVFSAYKEGIRLNPSPSLLPFLSSQQGNTMSMDLVLIQRWAITVI